MLFWNNGLGLNIQLHLNFIFDFYLCLAYPAIRSSTPYNHFIIFSISIHILNIAILAHPEIWVVHPWSKHSVLLTQLKNSTKVFSITRWSFGPVWYQPTILSLALTFLNMAYICSKYSWSRYQTSRSFSSSSKGRANEFEMSNCWQTSLKMKPKCNQNKVIPS